MANRLREEDRTLWRDAMRGVKPLRRRMAATTSAAVSEPASLHPPIPAPVKRGKVGAEGVASALDRRTLTRLKRGEMPIEARLDLHGLTQEAAHRTLVRFVAEAAADGVRLALVITGKGRGGEGVLREAVPRWLAEPACRAGILAVSPAAAKHGGGGALYVLLRRTRA